MIYIALIAFIVLLITAFWQGSLLWATIIGSPVVYSNPRAVEDCLVLAKAKKGETVVDLGCGNAKTLIHMARKFGVKGVGVDRSLFCFWRARMNVWLSGQSKNIKIIRGDFSKAERYLKTADIVYLYLLTSTMAQIEDWLFDSIGDKTRIVSLAFQFKNHKPIAEIETYTLRHKTKARLYRRT